MGVAIKIFQYRGVAFQQLVCVCVGGGGGGGGGGGQGLRPQTSHTHPLHACSPGQGPTQPHDNAKNAC